MELEIQKYLMSKFSSLSFTFFDGIEEVSYPYGRFGYTHTKEFPNKSTDGQEITVQIDLFSDYNGQAEIKQMINEVRSVVKKSFFIKDTTIHQLGINIQVLEESSDNKHLYHGVVELTLGHY